MSLYWIVRDGYGSGPWRPFACDRGPWAAGYGSKWIRFTHEWLETSEGSKIPFALNEDGTVTLDGKMEEMDFAAERVTRELMQ